MGVPQAKPRTQNDVSLENLLSGGITGGRRQTVGGRQLNSLGVESILYDSSRSSDYYAGEAARLLGEATTLEHYGRAMMESLTSNIRVAQDLKKKYSIEGLNPVEYALENEATGTTKVNFWKKVWLTIQAFFHRLVLAVANFVKQIQVWVSGPIAKSQADFYTKNKGAIEAALKTDAANQTITALATKVDVATTMHSMVAVLDATGKDCEAVEKSFENAIRSDRPADYIQKTGGQAAFEKIVAHLSSLAGQTGANKNLFPGRPMVNAIVYGSENPKPSTVAIGKTFEAKDFAILGYDGFTQVKNSLNIGKKQLAGISKTMKLVAQAAAKVEKAAGATGSAADDLSGSDLRALTAEAHNVQKIRGAGVNVLYAVFSVYMRQRGYLMVAARTLLKTSSKAEAQAKKAATPNALA